MNVVGCGGTYSQTSCTSRSLITTLASLTLEGEREEESMEMSDEHHVDIQTIIRISTTLSTPKIILSIFYFILQYHFFFTL